MKRNYCRFNVRHYPLILWTRKIINIRRLQIFAESSYADIDVRALCLVPIFLIIDPTITRRNDTFRYHLNYFRHIFQHPSRRVIGLKRTSDNYRWLYDSYPENRRPNRILTGVDYIDLLFAMEETFRKGERSIRFTRCRKYFLYYAHSSRTYHGSFFIKTESFTARGGGTSNSRIVINVTTV